MITNKVLIFLFIISLVHCEAQNSRFGNAKNELKFSENLKNKFDETQLRGRAEDIVRLIQEKCEKNGGPNAFVTLRVAFEKINSCLYRVLEEEPNLLYKALPVNSTIQGLCIKSPYMIQCFNKAAEALRPCLTANEDLYLDNEKNALHELLTFACYNEGQRMKEFVVEGGLDCFYSQETEIGRCLQTILERYDSNFNLTSDNLVDELLGTKKCAMIGELRDCARNMFRQCNVSSPMNFIESVFDIMLKRAPCHGQTETSTEQGEKMKPKVAQTEYLACRELSEFDAAGISVSKKLARMDHAQAIYAESLIHVLLRKGLLKKIKEDTMFCEGAFTKPRYYA